MKLAITHLSHSYKETDALKDICFTLHDGDFLTIIGPNGSGKSTLLKCLIRILNFKQGEVLLENQNIKKIPMATLSRKMAYVPQREEVCMQNTV